ncbi:MAG TPA: hotdog domain-containing protein [Nocardioidaceae bacterium]|jgi:predicted thioesterase|nr:hotdog domain-containing protein [Nocardioidaceae bacterium]
MRVGASTRVEFTVTEDDTAAAVGSGSLPVLGTPRLLAWCEAATCAVVEDALPAGRTSVGTRVSLDHLAASPVGERVVVTAAVSYVDPAPGPQGSARLLRLEVVALRHGDEKVLAHGEVTRVVVDAERFLTRLR